MPRAPHAPSPPDAAQRRAAKPVIVYAVDRLPAYDAAFYDNARSGMAKIGETMVPPREGRAFDVPAGHFFRIVSIEGPQVGDLNLWNAQDLSERFYSGKTRALHATHLSTGDRLWSTFPRLRPMATITHDTLDWYGWDEDGAGVHDGSGANSRDEQKRFPFAAVETSSPKHRVPDLRRSLALNAQTSQSELSLPDAV